MKNWRESRKVFRAVYESPNFTFEAFSTEADHAKGCLLDALALHGEQYRLIPEWFANKGEIEIQEIILGAGYRDGERLTRHAEFIRYCLDFYGPGGIYDIGATAAEVEAALDARMAHEIPFEGDSVDRELIRDIITEARGTT
jgi:hypothetical protein